MAAAASPTPACGGAGASALASFPSPIDPVSKEQKSMLTEDLIALGVLKTTPDEIAAYVERIFSEIATAGPMEKGRHFPSGDRDQILIEAKIKPDTGSKPMYRSFDVIRAAGSDAAGIPPRLYLVIRLNKTLGFFKRTDILLGKGSSKKVTAGILVPLPTAGDETGARLPTKLVAVSTQLIERKEQLQDHEYSLRFIKRQEDSIQRELHMMGLFSEGSKGDRIIAEHRYSSYTRRPMNGCYPARSALDKERKATGKRPCDKHLFVTELTRKGTLSEAMETMELEKGPPISLSERVDALQSAAEALVIVHANGYIYNDLKANQILRFSDGWRLIDYGTARKPEELLDPKMIWDFTELACSPELYRTLRKNRDRATEEANEEATDEAAEEASEGVSDIDPTLLFKNDSWSLGMLLKQLFSESYVIPDPYVYGMELTEKLLAMTDETMQKDISDAISWLSGKPYHTTLENTLRALLAVDPARRASMAEAVELLRRLKAEIDASDGSASGSGAAAGGGAGASAAKF